MLQEQMGNRYSFHLVLKEERHASETDVRQTKGVEKACGKTESPPPTTELPQLKQTSLCKRILL